MTPEQSEAVEIKNIDRRQQARWLILLASMAGALWLMLAPFVSVLLWAGVLTLSFMPVYQRILARTGKPSLSAAISTLFVVFVIGVPMGLVAWAIIREIVPAIAMLQGAFGAFLDPNGEAAGPAMDWLGKQVDLPRARLQINERLGEMSTVIASHTMGVVGGILSLVIQALFVVFVMFYLFRDGKMIREAMASAIPLRNRETRVILSRVTEVVGSSSDSVQQAIQNGIERVARTVRNVEWFETTTIRGRVEDGQIAAYQVGLKVGFRLEG